MTLFKTCIVIFTSVSMSISLSEQLDPNVLNMITEAFVGKFLANCSMDYGAMAPRAIPKIAAMTVTHNEIRYNLYDDWKIATSPMLDRSLPTIVVVHGFFGNIYAPIMMPMITMLKQNVRSNLFILDHTSLTSDSYYVSAIDTHFVGIALGQFIARLYLHGVRNFHFIGLSLGAHACGVAGKTFKSLTNVEIDRITGIDPAGPCFQYESDESILVKTDAKFVDVIHTDMNNFGMNKATGHVDFFPNEGRRMLGCYIPSCSHLVSAFYFAESVVKNNFLAVKCADWATFNSGACAFNPRVPMGYFTPVDTPHGNYYLKVRATPSYGIGEFGVVKPGIFNLLGNLLVG